MHERARSREEEEDVSLVLSSEQAIATGEVIADYGEPTRWSDWDASVFLMTKVGQQLQGEYQLCNGYGTDKATPVLRVSYAMHFIYVHCPFPRPHPSVGRPRASCR